MSHPAAKAVIGFYHRHAEQWDTLRQRYFAEKAWLDRFLSYLAPDSQILDLGCGSGCPIAAYFIDHQHHITGVDSSKPLINLCQQRFPTQRWMESDMRHLSLNQTYQGILAWDSFFIWSRKINVLCLIFLYSMRYKARYSCLQVVLMMVKPLMIFLVSHFIMLACRTMSITHY